MISDDFESKKPLYERLAKAVRPLLEQLATENKIAVALVEHRVKEQDSLEQKIGRPDKSGKYNKLEDITDLCGLRIVLFTNEDCELMATAIRNNFDIDDANSIIKGSDFEEDRFGYLSTHLVASLPQTRTKLFEFRHLANLKMEIQIRTVLQHAWAVLDWKLRYKSEIEVPKEFRRRLFRISALLEAADDAFSDLQCSVKNLRDEYTNEIRQGKFSIPLNRDSLESFLLQSETVKAVFDRCDRLGIKILRSGGPDTAYDYLIHSLVACGVTTLDQFEVKLRDIQENDLDHLAAIAKSSHRTFGMFTPLRILMISKLPPEERWRVIEEVPSDKKIGEAERIHFATEQKDGKLR
jgi:ppGpp synthetase/RelA/SpoT-type nucleotidyltranferase